MEKQIEHSMLTPTIGVDHQLKKMLNKVSGVIGIGPEINNIYWTAEHYNLHKSSLYNALSEIEQNKVLSNLSRWSLELIYFIEKFGLNYGAKMILKSDSEEEKSLYSLFAGDEVRHRLMIEPFLLAGQPTDISIHPLLASLNTCLAEGSKQTMTFAIQVILEGFGLSHYMSLKQSCVNSDLAHVFEQILKDEVNHHGMGVVLAKNMDLDTNDKSQISDMTHMFMRSLLDAEWVLKSLNQVVGGLTFQQKNIFREETQWRESQNQKTTKIMQLISKVGYADVCKSSFL